jgi:hypothetical protein
MTVKEYLDQHKLLCDRIQKDEESLNFLCPVVSDPHTPQLTPDHVQFSPTGDAPFVANLEYIAGVKEKIASEKAILRRLTDEIQVMFSVLDPYAYMQMTQRYLYHMSWDEIIGSTKSCRASVFNWHKKALSLCTLPDNPVNIFEELPWLRKAS